MDMTSQEENICVVIVNINVRIAWMGFRCISKYFAMMYSALKDWGIPIAR